MKVDQKIKIIELVIVGSIVIIISLTLLGIIPGIFCYTNIGDNAIHGFSPQLIISVSILLAFLILTIVIAKNIIIK